MIPSFSVLSGKSFSSSVQTNKPLLKLQVAAPMLSYWILVRPFLGHPESGSPSPGLRPVIIITMDLGFGWRYCPFSRALTWMPMGRQQREVCESSIWVNVWTHMETEVPTHLPSSDWMWLFSKSSWWIQSFYVYDGCSWRQAPYTHHFAVICQQAVP